MGMDADLISLLPIALRQLLLLLMVIVFGVFIVRTLLGQRRSLKLLVAYYCGRLLINNTLINLIWQHYYGHEQWWRVLYFILVPFCTALTYFMMYLTFNGRFLKVMMGAVIGEIVSLFFLIPGMVAVNYLEKQPRLFYLLYPIQWMDLLILVIDISLFCIFYYMAGPFLKRFRQYKLKHEKLLRYLFYLYLSFATLTVMPSMGSAVVIYLPIILLGGTILLLSVHMFRSHSRNIKMEHTYLLSQRRLMESYYSAIKEQIVRMEQSRELIDRQMVQIYSVGSESLGNGRIYEYIRELKEQYESIVAGIYCDDWEMDALLYYQGNRCKESGIATDFFVPGFSRGNILEEDIQQLFLQLFNYGILQNRERQGERKISIHVGTVKNQLVVQYMCTGNQEWKVIRRQLRPLIRKYNGSMEIEPQQDTLKLMIVLEKGLR